jgi:hypothetical protein
MECPDGLVFDVNTGVCNWPAGSNCDEHYHDQCEAAPTTTTTTTTTQVPTTTTTQAVTTTTTTQVPTTTTTQAVTTTTTQVATTTTTQAVTTTTTLPPTTTVCTTQPPPPPCTTEAPRPFSRCPDCVNARCTPNMCNMAAGVGYPNDCSKFCICENGGAIEMECPPGLVYDEYLQVCTWPEQSNCNNSNPYPGC